MPFERAFAATIAAVLVLGGIALVIVPFGQPFGAGLLWLAWRWYRFCKKS